MKRKLLYAVLLVQLAVIASAYFWYRAGLQYPRVMLRVEPVDPRDLLRGDYVVLHYEISQVPPEMLGNLNDEDVVYVALKQDGEHAVAEEYYRFIPQGKNQLYLMGRFKDGRLEFGMEKYFVPEGRGNPPLPWMMEVAIRENGQGQIVRLYSQGKPWQ